MKHATFAMLMAALLLTGSVTAAQAAQPVVPTDGPSYARHMERGNHFGPRYRGMNDNRWGHRGDRWNHDRRGFGMHGNCWEAIDLTERQRADMIDLMTKRYKAELELRMEMRDLRNATRDVWERDTATPDEIIAANTALGAARGKLDALRYQCREEMKNILTEEQLQTLDDRRCGPNGDRPHRAPWFR